ncbi:hypothetical protein J1N35_036490 [Gossypium stocksii]|uniref:PGG domain-containing protein n=1 Tax=Gossypium stocksii TaxID=47602 RepID=A0A9D3ZJZ6_9ROSI|nr:hypothetical protein J1N35_036490 [Gossypium stocksii]
MHLALQNQKTQAVLRLLRFDEGLVRVKGREGFTPLHHVVQNGNVDFLIKFLEVCPEAIEDVTVRDETVFHLTVKNDRFEAFQVLVGWLIRSRHKAADRWEKEILSWADIDGNTALYVAAIRNRPQVVKVLLERLCGDHINAKNAEGLTALDIPSQYPLDEGKVDYKESIKDMISKAGGLSGSLLPNKSSSIHINSLKQKMSCFQKFATIASRGKKGIPYDMPNTFLVVTVLIITATYDASLNPPKKPHENSSPPESSSPPHHLKYYSSLHSTGITAPVPSPSPTPWDELTDDSISTIMWFELLYVSAMFLLYNTFTFWAAIVLTVFLLPRRSICLKPYLLFLPHERELIKLVPLSALSPFQFLSPIVKLFVVSNMDQSFRTISRRGDVSELYKLIRRDGNVLRRFDEVEFIETPLHVAADEGCIGFAMEMMKLKPSFARKLNQQGLSPIHLALEKGHKEMVLRFLQMDKDLVRVAEKNGETPLHYICKVGNHDSLLETFLKACPDCIRDVTTENRSALHIATENNRLDVLQILFGTLKKKDYHREEVNRKDEDGNTALQIAARNNQTQMLKRLLSCKADKHATNQAGLTALGVAEQHNNRESIIILRGCFIPGVSNIKSKWEKQIVEYVAKASSIIFKDLDNISSDDRNALLVVLGLLLTGTYQAALSPPGGVWQGDYTELPKTSTDRGEVGRSVLKPSDFLLFYIPTYVVFMVTFFLTLALLKPFPHGFKKTIQVLLAFFAVCFDQSISFIAPAGFAYKVLEVFTLLFFVLTLVMFFTDRVSKPSVAILGCWLFPSDLFQFHSESCPDSQTDILGLAITACWLFLLKDDFWGGTIVVVGYCSYSITCLFFHSEDFGMWDIAIPLMPLGCWFFLYLFKFCFQQCCQRCST